MLVARFQQNANPMAQPMAQPTAQPMAQPMVQPEQLMAQLQLPMAQIGEEHLDRPSKEYPVKGRGASPAVD